MQKENLNLFIFIDALGWDILQSESFLEDDFPYRKKLESIMGYSSACVPSILTGKRPDEHGHFSFFYYSPETSPFKWLRPLRFTPSFIANRARVRNKISRVLQKLYGYTGYFQIYNVPFKYIHLFDYCEKKNIFAHDGITHGTNIFSLVSQSGWPYHVSNWRLSEEENTNALREDISAEKIRWAFLYNADLDYLLHVYGVGSDPVREKIHEYADRLKSLLAHVFSHYKDASIYVFSDHGQTNTTGHHTLWQDVEKLGYKFGIDYAAVYDSTMARFWFFNVDSRAAIIDLLAGKDYGRVLSDSELKRYGVFFPDRQYGELFFLLDEGHIIVPSFMGERPIIGMHGYHPEAASSYSMLIGNKPIPETVSSIPDLYHLMAKPLPTLEGGK